MGNNASRDAQGRRGSPGSARAGGRRGGEFARCESRRGESGERSAPSRSERAASNRRVAVKSRRARESPGPAAAQLRTSRPSNPTHMPHPKQAASALRVHYLPSHSHPRPHHHPGHRARAPLVINDDPASRNRIPDIADVLRAGQRLRSGAPCPPRPLSLGGDTVLPGPRLDASDGL